MKSMMISAIVMLAMAPAWSASKAYFNSQGEGIAKNPPPNCVEVFPIRMAKAYVEVGKHTYQNKSDGSLESIIVPIGKKEVSIPVFSISIENTDCYYFQTPEMAEFSTTTDAGEPLKLVVFNSISINTKSPMPKNYNTQLSTNYEKMNKETDFRFSSVSVDDINIKKIGVFLQSENLAINSGTAPLINENITAHVIIEDAP